ncbi:MAG: PAS domain S-box protein [Verrucomicrobiota bacterium]
MSNTELDSDSTKPTRLEAGKNGAEGDADSGEPQWLNAERTRTETALRESEEFNRSIVESSRDCIKILALDGTLLMITEGGRKMLCIEELEKYLGRQWIDFWRGEDRESARTAVSTAAAGQSGSMVGTFPRADGEVKWWDVLITPIRDATGTVTRLLAVSRDVTERRRSELNAALLAFVSQEIPLLTDISEILQTVGASVGAHLGVASCVFVEVDETSGTVEVTHEWRRDNVPSALGRYRLDDYFTEEFQESSRAGHTFVVSDTATDPRTDAAAFAALDIGSFLSVPVLRGGTWRFSLNIHHSEAHVWRNDEIELVNELTPRVLAHLDRVRAEETSSRLAAIVSSSDDVIISKDLNGIINSWNKGAEKLFGYTSREAIGQSVTLLMPPDRTGEEEKVLARIREGESIEHYETVRRVKDGRLIDIALTVSPIFNLRGEVIGASKIARDITARKRSAEALAASETRFRTAMGILTSIVWTNNAEGRMEGEQPGWAHFTGQSQEEYQDYGWSSAIHPEDARPTIDAWEQAVAGKCLFEFEHRVRRHDGEWRWCTVRAMPVMDGEGNIRDWVGVHHDITERRHANLNVLFLASISEDLLRISGMDPLMRTLGEKLGKHLGLSRCVFADVAEAVGKVEVIHDWLREPGRSLRGIYPLNGFLAPDFNRASLVGEPMVVCDTARDARGDAEKLASLNVGSFISLPFVRNNQLSFLLSIHHSEAHDWREDEIELMREVAARLWARLERSRAEDALARAMSESEQQRRLYHTVLSNTPDFIYVFDLNHRFSYINDALLKVYGMPWEEAKGKDWIALGYEAWHAEMHDREIDQVIATKAPIRGEIPFTGTTGRRIYDYIFSPVFDKNGEVEAVAGTTRDITDRKQAESAQAAERKVFERIATGAKLVEILDTLLLETEAQSQDGMLCSILLLDKSGRYLIPGAAPSLPEAYTLAMQHVPVGPSVGSCGSAAFLGMPVFVEDIATDPRWADFKDLAATHHLATCCSTPFLSLEGQVLGTVAMYYSHQHRPSEHDRQLVERAKRLAAIIIERKQAEDSLAEQTASLLRADRSKDEFLAMLAHELRNPLAPIRNATEILQNPAATPEDQNRARQLIARQTENMSRMIDDLLDVSRITEGKIELRRQVVKLQTVLTSAAEVARHSCDTNGQKLVVSLPEDPVFVDADSTRLEQLFGNLLSNACKYSGSGSDIHLSMEVGEDGEALVSISDNGIGIDPELLPRIFDLFVQSSRTLDRSHGGLGIGLTIVDRLVKLHGGTIEAHSGGFDQGAEFIVRLPLISLTVAPSSPEQKISDKAKSLRMLIVDDNHDAAETMAMLQRLHGHDTRTAHTGPAAVTLAAEFIPEVVLLDIGLPEMDGFEVARRLRSMPDMKNAFLIALTGYGTDADRQQAREAGFDEHLAKPADLKLLNEWLANR